MRKPLSDERGLLLPMLGKRRFRAAQNHTAYIRLTLPMAHEVNCFHTWFAQLYLAATITRMRKHDRAKVRLTTDIVPKKYEIRLKPDLEAFVFVGEETIFERKITYDEKSETATFTFKNALPKGNTRLKIIFRGVLNDRMHGFYRSNYEHEGKTRRLATTQFKSPDARRAFPCFDEPAMKEKARRASVDSNCV